MHSSPFLRTLTLAALPLLLVACSSSDEGTGKSAGPVLGNEDSGDSTRVEVVDLANGVAMDFTTTGDVDALRASVRRMAEMHNTMHDQAPPPDGHSEHHSTPGGEPGNDLDTGGSHLPGGRSASLLVTSGNEGCSGDASMDSLGGGMDSCCGGDMGMPGGHGDGTGSGMGGGMGMTDMPAAWALAEDIEGGARMSLFPAIAGDLEALRAYIRASMAGGCSMSGMGDQ